VVSFNNLPRGTLHKYDHPQKWYREYKERMSELLQLLDHPEKRIPHYIHIAGTSGKGSTATYLESIVRASGAKTGMMLSPYPTYIREQWQINGKPITRSQFTKFVSDIRPVIDQFFSSNRAHKLSLFDLETVLGLYIFASMKVDWAVVEVGLGGRYDSTNIIPYKDAVIITSIGLDHTEYLGNTKKKIAGEKAGIIISNAPVFTAVANHGVRQVINEACKLRGAKLYTIYPKDITGIKQTMSGTKFIFNARNYSIGSLGAHQSRNAVVCIRAAQELGFSEQSIRFGLKQAVQPIRMEVVSRNPYVILDGAHNADKMSSTIATLQVIRNTGHFDKLHLVVGFSHDKNWKSMVRQLFTAKPSTVACTRNTINPFRRVANPSEISAYIQNISPSTTVRVFLDPAGALEWSRTQTHKHDILLSTGSIFLSGELRPLLTKSHF
jgi:dihydrofolate synthase/folylpolyglutamate synthase